MVKYVKRSAIDTDRWNNCVVKADNSLLYARSFYLDAMTTHWDALIAGDYAAVMPLCWRKKYGVIYLYQPFLTAQLGIFGTGLTPELTKTFLEAIPLKFKLLEFPLNYANPVTSSKIQHFTRRNMILPLNADYDTIRLGYKETTVRNIRKASQSNCYTRSDLPLTNVLNLVQENTPFINSEGLKSFERLCTKPEVLSLIRIYSTHASDGHLLSAAVLFMDKKRAYYILPANDQKGRDIGASHLLIDRFIRDHATTGLILDFEGGDSEGLHFFYSSFGAEEEYYPMIMHNKLPYIIRLIKKFRS